MTVRTRFAPSPTGYLHIGGVRTALFNWLFARRHGGQFILRIDDTDVERHVEGAIEKIVDGLRWIGMQWDEGPQVGGPCEPYFQSQRRPFHDKALVALIESGHAYPCRVSAAELDKQRDTAKTAKKPFVYRGPERDLPPSEALAIFREHKTALRYKVPLGETTVLEDYVRGKVEWQTDLLGDFTIARAGGDPLYNLASIVDDVEMKITHIIRAEEHLSNTHPQLLIAKGLSAPLPRFAHVPYVAAPGGKKKLSKRNPPPGVMVALDEYDRAGYLPEALINALARIGWSLDDKSEIIPLQTIIENFSLERITASPAALDPDKIYWVQDHYMRQLPPKERVDRMIPFLVDAKLVANPPTAAERATIEQIDAACGDRLKLLADIVRYGAFFFKDELEFEPQAAKHLKRDGIGQLLTTLKDALAAVELFNLETVGAAVHKVAEESGVGGKINHILRAALTGKTVGPGVFECALILGKEKTLARLEATKRDLEAGKIA